MENLNNKQQFIEDMSKAKRYIVGNETYGDLTEFYDEDGCIVLTVCVNAEKNTLIFNFILSGNTYEYEEKEIEREKSDNEDENKNKNELFKFKININ